MKYATTINDKTYLIEINDDRRVFVDGVEYAVDFESVDGQPVYSLLLDGRSYEAYVYEAEDSDGCIVLDINMPGMGGLDFLRMLRRRESPLCVVVLTATQTPRLEELVLEFGASAFLAKPVREAALVEALRAALARR